MGKVLDSISDELAAWITDQPMFFVATAPSGSDGHVNVSPKGLDGTFSVLGPDRVAYLDLTGSGVETIAHLRENGRITIMLCAFTGKPKICRLHGHGTVHLPDSDGWRALASRFGEHLGARAVVDVAVERVSSSCGFGVPLMDLVGQRDELTRWSERKGPEGLADYHATRNAASIDGLPGYPASADAR